MPKKTAASEASAMNMYEVMLILNPDLRDPEVKKKLKEIVDTVEKVGGKVTQEDIWGKRELSYRIKLQNEGIYVVYNFELPSSFLPELKQNLRIEKDILRSMIIKLPHGYTYTKFDMTMEEKPKREKESYSQKKNVSIKHNSPIVHSKKKEETEVKEPKNLDKKLNEILGGSDLKL